MREEQTVYPNDTTRKIQSTIRHLEEWRIDNDRCDQRYVSIVITKLEEAELFSLRMIKHDD